MTYTYRVLKDGPLGLWSLDILSGSNFADSSGYGNTATKTGTPATTRPIVAGGIAAQQLTSGTTLSYPIDDFMIAGKATRGFSIEAWIKVQSTGATTIISRNSSGLFIDADYTLRFTINMGSANDITYNKLIKGNVYHVVAVYDTQGMYLYLNGQIVGSLDLTVTDFADTATTLNTTPGTGFTMVLDSVSVYNYALGNTAVAAHYAMGTDYPEIVNLSLFNGGKSYQPYDEEAGLYAKYVFDTDEEWSLGRFTGAVKNINDQLVNLFDETTVQWEDGTWEFSISFEADPVFLNGSRIKWDSTSSVTVEYTPNGGSSYTALTNGGQIVGNVDLSVGYNLSVRVTIPAGSTQTILRSLSIALYTTKNISGSDDLLPAVVVNPLAASGGVVATLADQNYSPASFNDNMGILLPNANSGLVIAPDTEFGGYCAVEMAVFIDSLTNSKTVLYVESASSQPQITSNGSGQWTFSNLTALYVNGASVTSPYTITSGKWHHVIAVFPASQFNVHIGNNVANTAGYPMRVGFAALYLNTLSATQVGQIYNTWVGAPATQIVESNVINVNEYTYPDTSKPFRAYAYDWAITGAG